jgi:hypothetical protein
MKKTRLAVPLLAMILAMASAFSPAKKLSGTLYFTTNGSHFEEKGMGLCDTGGYNCTYEARDENPNPDPDTPGDYIAVGDDGVWVE